MTHPLFDPLDTPLPPGTALIEASAGTGKTYTLTAIFLRLVLEAGLPVREILVTTFTEAATAELRDRIRTKLQSALAAFTMEEVSQDPLLAGLVERHQEDPVTAIGRLRQALRSFDEAAIYTIHGFCQRMLQERAFESGHLFDAELITEQRPLLRELAEDFWRHHFYDAPALACALTEAAKVSPETLFYLLEGALRFPLLTVLPAGATEDWLTLQTDLHTLHGELRECWHNEGAAIRAQLLGPPKWANGGARVGSSAKLQPIFSAISAALEGDHALDGMAELAAFVPAVLRKAALKGSSAPAHRFYDLCERYAAIPARWATALKARFLQWAVAEIERRKLLRNELGFSDLLTRLHAALHGPQGETLALLLRKRFRAALIDEFQDTDGVQEAIFQRIFPGSEGWLFFIGDPKQAIYGFRGASVFTYLKAADSAAQRYTLGTNRRSARALVGAVNSLFGRHPGAFIQDGIAFGPVDACGDRDALPLRIGGEAQPPLRVWACEVEGKRIGVTEAGRDLPLATALGIAQLLAQRATIGGEPLCPPHIAVLVAKHAQGRAVQEALHAHGVPSVLLSDESVWQSFEGEELARLLAAVAEPGREAVLRGALATEMLGACAQDLEHLAQSERDWESCLVRFARYRQRWEEAGFTAMFRTLLLGEGIRGRLLALPDGDRRMTNLLHLGELLGNAAGEFRLGSAALLRWFAAQRTSGLPARGGEGELRLERDDDAVQIITMHRAKGLEYDVVFCPFAWGRTDLSRNGSELIFHDPSASHGITLDLGSPAEEHHRTLLAREQLAEELRLLYVALTRAKHQCYIVWGLFNTCEVSAGSWLMHRPPVWQEITREAGCLSEVESLRAHVKTLTGVQMKADLASLAAHAPGCIEIGCLPEGSAPTWSAPERGAGGRPQARGFAGSIDRDWCISSFTSLTEQHGAELPDYDRLRVVSASDVADPDAEGPLEAQGIHLFPGGARAGVCLHEILEEIDFAASSAQILTLVRRKLAAFSYDPGQWEAIVADCVERLLTTPLPAGFALADVARESRLAELEFYVPADRLEPAALTALSGLAGVDALEFEPRRGWLKGFIDLVFQHEDRFYIVDWKSNRLGPHAVAYDPKALATTMARRHYTLQLHLYTVALHRYLQWRLPGYSYEAHFGGVYYIFLRGVDSAYDGFGIHAERPSLERVEALSDWMRGDEDLAMNRTPG